MKNKKFAILGGAGKMGMALIKGLIDKCDVSPSSISATARRKKSFELLAQNGIAAFKKNSDAIKDADVITVAVHPDATIEVLKEIAPVITKDQLLISIVTGVPLSKLEEFLPGNIPVIRAMPNVAAVVGQSSTVICSGTHITPKHVELAQSLFSAIGIVEQLEECHMNAATGLGGCSPAFVFKIIEAMSEGGVKMGLPRDVSRKMAAQVVKGAATMVLETNMHPAELKDAVTTPGGCTIDGIAKLQERGIAIALIDAVEVSSLKAGSLMTD